MKHTNYKYEIGEEVSFAANEATINMDFYRTKSFLDRHSDHQNIEEAMPLHEGFEALRQKLKHKYSEKENSLIS